MTTARRLCRGVLAAFLLLYVLSLILFVIGTFGLFGSPKGPLAGVFLVILGLPWTPLLDFVPDSFGLWTGLLVPALNAVALALVCRLGAGRRDR